MRLTYKGYKISISMIVYLIVVACIGFMVSYFLFSISSLPVSNELFRITNVLTAILWVIICLALTAGLVCLAYISIPYLKEKAIVKTPLVKAKSKLQIIWHNYRKQPLKYLVITIIVLITLIKLNLIGTGFLAIHDEVRYCQSGIALQNLLEFKIRAAIRAIYLTQGRPVDGVLKIIPITIQYITAYIYNLNWYESNNSYPLFFYNFIIYCIIIFVHFKMSKFLLKDSFLALISVLIFSTVTNSYLYLRHALPYDMSLLIFYLVIYKIVIYTDENSLSFKKSLIIGIFSFLGYLVYPGYFSLFIVSLFMLFFNNISKKDIYKRLYYSGYYILGSILCLYICEKIARLVGTSYMLDAIGLSKTITQGSFDESFAYILKYFIEVEGLTGIILLISLLVFYLITLYQIKNKTLKEYSPITLLGIALIGNYLSYASAGYFLHKVVFYGRLLHQYVPFICIFSVYVINELLVKITRKKEFILFLTSVIFVVNFCFNFIHYNSYVYPRDIAWELIKENNSNYIENEFENDDLWPVMPKRIDLKCYDIDGKLIKLYYNIILLGGFSYCNIYIINDLTKNYIFNRNDNYYLLEFKPSFMNFKAYQYEMGGTKTDRDYMDKNIIQIKIFSK